MLFLRTMKQKWMNPIEGQFFKTKKGVYSIVGIWRNPISGEIISFEVKDDQKNVTEVKADIFRSNESKIEYFDNNP